MHVFATPSFLDFLFDFSLKYFICIILRHALHYHYTHDAYVSVYCLVGIEKISVISLVFVCIFFGGGVTIVPKSRACGEVEDGPKHIKTTIYGFV